MNLRRFFTLTWLSIVVCALIFVGQHAVARAQTAGDVNESFFADMQFLSENTTATLLFVPFPSNADFAKHNLSDDSVTRICTAASGGATNDCGNMGVNFGTMFRGDFYQKARSFGMKWTSEIADVSNTKDVVEAINLHGVDPNKVVIRFGVVGNGIGATQDPNSVINFLKGVGGQVDGKEFYAIAGPNEPDLETWAAPDCGQAPGAPDDPANPSQTAEKDWYTCVAPKLANFMNAVCDAKNSGKIPANVKLITPVFNMTSYTFKGLTAAMKTAGARFSDPCFAAIGGNIYPLGKSVQAHWTDNGIAAFASAVGKPIIITETGPMSGDGAGSGNGTGNNKNTIPAYNKTPFPPYDADPLDYYLQPIKGLAPNANVQEIRQDLAFQGYQAYCAAPRYIVDRRYDSEDLIDRFLKSNSGVLLTVSSKFELNTQNTLYPLFRDVEGNQWLTNSIEEFWGFSDTVSSDYTTKELNTAPINSLLNQEQRCVQSVKTLYAIEEMCNKLENPESCVLYTRKIPTRDITTKELLANYRTFARGNDDPTKISSFCENIVKNEENNELKKSLLITPLNLDRSYRLGFLVASVKQSRDVENKVFSFLSINKRGGGYPGTPPHEVLIVAFKLPDNLTNKGQVTAETSATNSQKNSGSTGWNDAALLTRNVLLPQSTIDEVEQKGIDLRTTTLQLAEERARQTNDDSIQCVAGANASGSEVGIGSSYLCKDPMGKAIVDIVNAYRPNCTVPLGKAETSNQINDPAGIQIREAPIFSDPYGRNLLANLFMSTAGEGPRNQVYPQQRFDQGVLDFVSFFRIDRKAWPVNRSSDSTVDFYLVYPVGYDLEQVEKTVAGTFFTTSQIEALASDPYNKPYFQMDPEKRLTANTASHSFYDRTQPCGVGTFGPIYCMKTFTVTVASGAYEKIKVLGGRLGYWMRTIQRKLSPLASESQKYFTGCRTTEEFLLGRCRKRSPDDAKPDTRSETLPSFCGTDQLYLSNNQTNYFEVCTSVGGECSPLDPDDDKYFLDETSEYSLKINSRIIDGATLITTNNVVAMNPGQNFVSETSFSRCGQGPSDMSGVLQIWYLPPSVPANLVNGEITWNQFGSRLLPQTGTSTWTNLTINLRVKPGYYLIKNETHGCISRGTIYMANGVPENSDKFKLGTSIIPVGIGDDGRDAYCATATFNSNMPGGPEDKEQVLMDKSFDCPLSKSYNITLNNSCGGLNSSDDLQLWHNLLQEHLSGVDVFPGLKNYEKIFGRKFDIPNEVYSCDWFFPSVIRETPCDQVSNGDVDGSVGEIPEFSIKRWKSQGNNQMLDPEPGADTTFKLPSDPAYREELMAAINSASAKHQCDPLLVLSVLHSESAGFVNGPENKDAAKAMGVAQITPGTWGIWWTGGCHQPPTFTAPEAKPGLDKRADINLSVDAACRLILWTDMQAYPEDNDKFVTSFAIRGGNFYGQIWNFHTPQADYVYRLWQKLRTQTGRPAMSPQSGYPGNQCG